MQEHSLSDGLQADDVPQQRPLTGGEREVLHRVIGTLEDNPGYAGMLSPGLRAVIGDGTQPQQRELTGQERAGLGDMLRRLVEEWESPRLPWEQPAPGRDLSGGDIARLGLIWRAVTPDHEDPERPLVVNAADWAPPVPVPDSWLIANAPRPIQGPPNARAWQGESRHGSFYAAWPISDDDDAFWEKSGAREVLVFTNQDIAGEAGQYLAACGLLPGEAGLTATDVARRLRHPWKDGILDDEQAQYAALAAILDLRRDNEETAYDFSDGPQRRELTDGERAFLFRLIGQAAADPRFASGEIIRRPVIRAVLGDGTRPQARPLTARERDDIGWLVNHIRSEWLYARERPGSEHPSPWAAGLPGSDIARLGLVGNAVTPRHGTPYQDGPVLVNAAGWSPPEPLPDNWVIGNAPVPLSGPITWQGNHTTHGEFYAAAPDDNDPYGGWLIECADARRVEVTTDRDAVAASYAFLGRYGCAAPEDAGMTIAEVARDLGYPLTVGGAADADAAARATFVLRASRANGDVAWYAVHGVGRRDRLARLAAQDGWQVTPASEIPLGDAPPGMREMAAVALGHGWDLAYTNEKGETELMAVNGATSGRVSRVWDAGGRLVRDGDLKKITASPRSPYVRPGGALELPAPVALSFPEKTVTAPRRGGRADRTGNRATRGRRTPPLGP